MAKNNENTADIPNEPKTVSLREGEVVVDQKTLTKVLERQAEIEKELEDARAKTAGMEELFASQASEAEPAIRKRKDFEPKFRTVRIRKFPMKGDVENKGYVIGWTDRGAYQKVDRTGVSPQIVDYIDVVFLGHERNAEGKLQAESVPLLELLNSSEPVNCKILETHKKIRDEATGEEIAVLTWDPKHGGTPMDSGERVDGFVQYTDIQYDIQIPGVDHPVRVDAKFCN